MPKIDDTIIGKIDHSKCRHAKNSQEYKKCRERKIKEALREQEADQPSDQDEALARIEEALDIEGEPEEHVAVIGLDDIEALRNMLEDMDGRLREFGDVLEATIHIETERFGPVEVVYGTEANGWGIRL